MYLFFCCLHFFWCTALNALGKEQGSELGNTWFFCTTYPPCTLFCLFSEIASQTWVLLQFLLSFSAFILFLKKKKKNYLILTLCWVGIPLLEGIFFLNQNVRLRVDIKPVAPPLFAGEKHIQLTGLPSKQNFFPCLLKQKIINLTRRIFLYSKCQLHSLPISFQEKVTIFLSIPTEASTPSVHFSRKNGSIFLATPLIIINITVVKQ